MLSDDDVEVFLKLYVLLYADDTVIFAENATELQKALNAMFEYCNLWKLKVNPNKTKVLVFWKNKRGLQNLPRFYYDHKVLEIVDFFPYLGVRFCYNGKFHLTKAHLIAQAKKAMYSIIKKSRKLSLPI